MVATPTPASLTGATPLVDGLLIRPAAESDAAALAAAYRASREHLRPWEPRRTEDFFTTEGQRARLREQAAERRAGRVAAWVLVDGDEIAGAATLSGIVRGPFQSASLGYWIAAGHVGRGLATATARAVCQIADRDLGLHRVQAGTLTHNVRSQRVLAKCGFVRFGTAERYLHIDGAWQDHVLFQRLLNDRHPA
ncbi:GNAT family N-acetyltransferase [Streptomyces sp. NPDC057702]|uniref:GNAT family N-acetyltransferase n=1 Tax=unclassified Streptomyces TaxID=2593676 RepID=UPI003683A7B3